LSTIKSADLRSLNEISLTGISRSPSSIFQDENNAVNHRSLDPSKELLQFADERFWKMTSVSACTKFALGTTPDPVLSPCFSHQLRRSSPTRCEEAEIENDFQKKVQEGCKIRRTYGIFGYTRRDKLFIFVGVGSFHPLSRRIVSTTHAPLRNNSCQLSGVGSQRKATANDQRLTAVFKERLQQLRRTSG
jgi:hypothetical protein